ncbi:MAG TPA: hypothetical protein VHU15_10455 [Stellaceae bacterium]|nr:hypothetical protein [Stellaceae bacterium]
MSKDILLGMNIVTLAGFAVMAIAINLSRTRTVQAPLGIAMMAAGTALVFLGLYMHGAAH